MPSDQLPEMFQVIYLLYVLHITLLCEYEISLQLSDSKERKKTFDGPEVPGLSAFKLFQKIGLVEIIAMINIMKMYVK